MGIYPSIDGGLTESQKYQADMLGMSHEKYLKFIQRRLIEMRGGEMPLAKEGVKKNYIQAERPVLVIGHGPSYTKYMSYYKDFPGTKIVVDHSLEDCLEAGFNPDYVVTLESSKQTCKLYFFDPQKIVDKNITVIHSSITRPEVVEKFVNAKVPITKFDFNEEPRCSNVGLFAINFARQDLKADKIFIVGFEHVGTEYPLFTYQLWQTDFFYFMKKWPKETIINCSNGGALYYRDFIVQTTLDKVKIL